jgi:hypothetical protein
MTGIPDYNFPEFHRVAALWRGRGWAVVNPAEEFDGDTRRPYRDYVVRDIQRLRMCDAIVMLCGWDGNGARGSVWEHEIAAQLFGIPIYYDGADIIPAPDGPATTAARAETILEEAQRLVHGDRGADYGHPVDDYTRTGRLWGAILGLPDLDPRLCALMMAAVKVSREVNKHKRDNLTDLAGYAECAQMIADRQAAK